MKTVEHINPPGLLKSPVFSQAISVSGAARTIYVGGQDAVDAEGNLVGGTDLRAEAAQAVKNLRLALEGAGAGLAHLVKTTVYLVQGQPLQPAFEAWMEEWGARKDPPTVSMVFVAGLGRPGLLIEIDAVAVVPAGEEPR